MKTKRREIIYSNIKQSFYALHSYTQNGFETEELSLYAIKSWGLVVNQESGAINAI